MLRLTVMGTVIVLAWLFADVCGGAEPHWSAPVIARGEVRDRIESTPMVARPYRPLHFYGNTVRRLHYRGDLLPRTQDIRNGWLALTRRRYMPL